MQPELDVAFEDFIEKIILSRTQRERIDKTVSTAESIFEGADVKLQGSFATGTTVKPLTKEASKNGVAGEYDADIALVSSRWTEPRDTLNKVLEALSNTYGDKVDRAKKHNSCERVHFAEETTGVAFHADYVPIKTSHLDKTDCANRQENQWQLSPTFKIIDCYNDFANSNPFASSCLLILKRLRDFHELTDSLPSIALLTLMCTNYSEKDSYVEDLRHLCVVITKILSDNESIVFHERSGLALTEELGQNIKNVTQIVNLLKDFELVLKQLTIDNLEPMQYYLSGDFPSDENDYPPQIQSLRSQGFSYDTVHGLETIEIDSVEHGSEFYKRYRNTMYFTQNVTMKLKAKNHRDLKSRNLNAKWRITNDQRKVPNDVRGGLLPRESNNEFIKKETAKYEGLHRAEIFLFANKNKKIIGKGRYKVKKVISL